MMGKDLRPRGRRRHDGRKTSDAALRRAALAQDGGPTDGELMKRFTARRDAAALEALIRRHGPMVLAVCRRVLGNEPDAEDAFQAAFLVFVRKAASVPAPGAGRRLAVRRGLPHGDEGTGGGGAAAREERRAAAMTPMQTEPEERWAELLPLLDRELSRLPEKYRTAIVLCELEGRSRKEAAGKLGVPEGTLSSRLATGKRMLARRLAPTSPPRPGAPGRGAGASGRVGRPPPLLASTAKAAALVAVGQAAAAVVSTRVAALAEGVLKSMLLTKLTIAVLAAIAVVATGVAAVACRPDGVAHPAVAGCREHRAGRRTRRTRQRREAGRQARRSDRPYRGAAEGRGRRPGTEGRIGPDQRRRGPHAVCTLTPGNDGLGGAFGQNFRPDWWKSDRPSLETSAKAVVTLAPGKSISFPFTILRVHYKDRDSFTITGFYAVEDKEFAEKLGLWVGKAEAKPVEVEVSKESAWGEAVDGVQARLRPTKTAWDVGETPEFRPGHAEPGEKAPYQCRVPNFCEIEWDGQWYAYGDKGDLECKSTALEPGKEIDDWVKASLDIPWVHKKDDKEERLQVAPGKHTMRRRLSV